MAGLGPSIPTREVHWMHWFRTCISMSLHTAACQREMVLLLLHHQERLLLEIQACFLCVNSFFRVSNVAPAKICLRFSSLALLPLPSQRSSMSPFFR